MPKLKDLLEEHFIAGGIVSTPALGVRQTFKTNMKDRPIVEVEDEEKEEPIDEKKFMESVNNFNNIGEELYRKTSLKELASHLGWVCETASRHAVNELDGWFDKVTVSRNMKELKKLGGNFGKIATEAQDLQERMAVLYEDMGHILGRYYTIGEDTNSKVKEQKVKFSKLITQKNNK